MCYAIVADAASDTAETMANAPIHFLRVLIYDKCLGVHIRHLNHIKGISVYKDQQGLIFGRH